MRMTLVLVRDEVTTAAVLVAVERGKANVRRGVGKDSCTSARHLSSAVTPDGASGQEKSEKSRSGEGSKWSRSGGMRKQ